MSPARKPRVVGDELEDEARRRRRLKEARARGREAHVERGVDAQRRRGFRVLAVDGRSAGVRRVRGARWRRPLPLP